MDSFLRVAVSRPAPQISLQDTLANNALIAGVKLSNAVTQNSRIQTRDAFSVVPLENQVDQSYYATIQMGTPPQQLLMQIDTGSSAVWVGSMNCNTKGRCNDRKGFNSAASSTYVNSSHGSPFTVTYGAGTVTGDASSETVSFGTYNIKTQPFLLASLEDQILFSQQAQRNDGLVGFALQGGLNPNTSSPLYSQTIMYSLVTEKIISNAIFSLWLNGSSTPNGFLVNNGGELVVGGIDQSHYSGNLIFYPTAQNIANNYYWMLQLSSVIVMSLKSTADTPITSSNLKFSASTTYAMLDSGTSLTLVDSVFFKTQFLPAIANGAGTLSSGKPVSLIINPNTGLVDVGCDAAQALPPIGFSFQGNDAVYQLMWQDYVVTDGKNCFLAFLGHSIQLADPNVGTWIFGDNFLRKVYSVYDFANGGRIGLAYSAGGHIAANLPVGEASVSFSGKTGSGTRVYYSKDAFIVACIIIVFMYC